jgi:preprotein translocase subunit SecB
MDHSFEIVRIRLIESHFALNREYKWEKKKTIEFQNDLVIGYEVAENILDVVVTVSSDSEDQPFRFSVSWGGSFSLKKMPPKNLLERFVHINCAAIIYPFIRETVGDLTRRAGVPPLNLDPFNFVSFYEETKIPQRSKSKKRVERPRLRG